MEVELKENSLNALSSPCAACYEDSDAQSLRDTLKPKTGRLRFLVDMLVWYFSQVIYSHHTIYVDKLSLDIFSLNHPLVDERTHVQRIPA